MPAPYSSILRECADVADERQDQYGDVSRNFADIANICKYAFGLEISTAGIAKVMIATKLSRELHKPKKDNLIDAVNYTAILAHLQS